MDSQAVDTSKQQRRDNRPQNGQGGEFEKRSGRGSRPASRTQEEQGGKGGQNGFPRHENGGGYQQREGGGSRRGGYENGGNYRGERNAHGGQPSPQQQNRANGHQKGQQSNISPEIRAKMDNLIQIAGPGRDHDIYAALQEAGFDEKKASEILIRSIPENGAGEQHASPNTWTDVVKQNKNQQQQQQQQQHQQQQHQQQHHQQQRSGQQQQQQQQKSNQGQTQGHVQAPQPQHVAAPQAQPEPQPALIARPPDEVANDLTNAIERQLHEMKMKAEMLQRIQQDLQFVSDKGQKEMRMLIEEKHQLNDNRNRLMEELKQVEDRLQVVDVEIDQKDKERAHTINELNRQAADLLSGKIIPNVTQQLQAVLPHVQHLQHPGTIGHARH